MNSRVVRDLRRVGLTEEIEAKLRIAGAETFRTRYGDYDDCWYLYIAGPGDGWSWSFTLYDGRHVEWDEIVAQVQRLASSLVPLK